MPIPATIRAGDTVKWVEPPQLDLDGNSATAAVWTLTTFLRFNAASEGATITGTARTDGGWDMLIPAGTSEGFDAGQWSWQSRISAGGVVITIGTGSFDVLPSLSYAGSPAAFDGRSQAEKDLEAVQAAIRSIISKGAKAYTINNRSFTYADLGELIQRESQLKAIVASEKAAQMVATGLGDPRSLYVRFG